MSGDQFAGVVAAYLDALAGDHNAAAADHDPFDGDRPRSRERSGESPVGGLYGRGL